LFSTELELFAVGVVVAVVEMGMLVCVTPLVVVGVVELFGPPMSE
jgi:hypothetical protein